MKQILIFFFLVHLQLSSSKIISRRRTPPLVIEEPTTTTSKPERATIRFSPTKGSTTVLPESTTYAKEVTNIWIAVKNTAKNASVTQEETSSKRQKRSSTGESGDFQTTTKLPESTTQAKATQNILIVVKNSTTNAQTQQTTSSKPEGPTTIPSKKGSGDFQTTTKLPEPTTQAKEATQKLVIVVQNSTTAATPTKETTPSKPERPTKIQSTKGSGNIQTTTKLPESTTQAKDILIIIKNSTTNAPTQQTRSSKPEGSTKIPSTKGSSNIQTTTKLPESTTQAKEILIIIKNSTTNAPTQQTTSLKPEKSTTEESGDIRTTTVLPGAIIKVEAAVKEILKVVENSTTVANETENRSTTSRPIIIGSSSRPIVPPSKDDQGLPKNAILFPLPHIDTSETRTHRPRPTHTSIKTTTEIPPFPSVTDSAQTFSVVLLPAFLLFVML